MEASKMRCSLLTLAAILAAGIGVGAQAPQNSYGLGRTPSAAEIRAWDFAIGPEGKELPPGSGTAKRGELVAIQRGCGACHGPTLTEGPAPRLVGGEVALHTNYYPVDHWPFATTVWDFINRAMPINNPGWLTPDEVYSLTALLLYRNGIIREDEVLDAVTLPKVQMPNRKGFITPPQWKPRTPRPFRE